MLNVVPLCVGGGYLCAGSLAEIVAQVCRLALNLYEANRRYNGIMVKMWNRGSVSSGCISGVLVEGGCVVCHPAMSRFVVNRVQQIAGWISQLIPPRSTSW